MTLSTTQSRSIDAGAASLAFTDANDPDPQIALRRACRRRTGGMAMVLETIGSAAASRPR